MEAYLYELLNLFGRWIHLITGIAWIGASFYFVWLDNHLQPAQLQADTDAGVSGEVWSVHGGGFYHAQKYLAGPPKLPDTLHWFKWEAYTTFLSGLFMLALIYWYGAEIYTIDPSVMVLSKAAAVSIGIATLVVGWVVYDRMCYAKWAQDEKKLGLALLVFVCLAAYGLSQVFSGRAAFIHYGAMLGTIMVANVYFIIIPGQVKMVASAAKGEIPDPIHGIRGKQRSVHNTYFTLPVLFVMISNHYALAFAHEYNWLILILISLMGALIRVYFVARHKGHASMAPLIAAAVCLVTMIALTAPRQSGEVNGEANPEMSSELEAVSFTQVKDIIQQRCNSCHSQTPTQAGFGTAPKGVVFDTDAQITSQAVQIQLQSVMSKAMPLGNLTQMTPTERQQIGQWFKARAK